MALLTTATWHDASRAQLQPAPADPAQMTVELQMSNIEGQKIFVPSRLVVPANTTMRLLLTNPSGTRHTFKSPSLFQEADAEWLQGQSQGASVGEDGALLVDPGGYAAIRFTTGDLDYHPFWCTVPGHAAWGMTGALLVMPAPGDPDAIPPADAAEAGPAGIPAQ